MLDEVRKKIEAEIVGLTQELNVLRPDRIQKAVELGDLRENSEYKSSLERQQFVQARIGHLAGRMAEVSKIATESVPSDFAGRSLAAALACGEGLPPRATRYVTFAGRKGIAPGWLSWMWSRKSALPLHLGKTQGDRKVVWSPETESVSIIDLNDDPFENEPSVHSRDDDTYEKETAELRRWFERTDLAQSEAQLTERDTEVLESLGYLQ